MPRKVLCCLLVMIALIILTPTPYALAAELSMHLHCYTIGGVAVGELYLADQIAFRLQVATDGDLPVISMQKGNMGTIIYPDIVNGMFMLKINPEK